MNGGGSGGKKRMILQAMGDHVQSFTKYHKLNNLIWVYEHNVPLIKYRSYKLLSRISKVDILEQMLIQKPMTCS
jgi:hypothetical protein